MTILFIVIVKILVLIKRLYRSRQLCWLLSLALISHWSIFRAHNPMIFFKDMSFWCPLLDSHQNTWIPLKYRCLNEKNSIVYVVYLVCVFLGSIWVWVWVWFHNTCWGDIRERRKCPMCVGCWFTSIWAHYTLTSLISCLSRNQSAHDIKELDMW